MSYLCCAGRRKYLKNFIKQIIFQFKLHKIFIQDHIELAAGVETENKHQFFPAISEWKFIADDALRKGAISTY